jgi:hypothetical protein
VSDPQATQAPDPTEPTEPVKPTPATEATPPLPPGSPAADADVQAARAAVDDARASFQREVTTLQAKGRDAIDIKAKVRRLPQTLAQDPRKLAGVAAAGAGIVGLVALRRRGRRAPVSNPLPAEVEAALSQLGKDGTKVRAALDQSFSRYLAMHGVEAGSKPRSVPPIVTSLVVPIGTVAVRELIQRVSGRRAASRADASTPPKTDGPRPG